VSPKSRLPKDTGGSGFQPRIKTIAAESRSHVLISFYPKGTIAMNTNRKPDSETREIDEVVSQTGGGDGKKIRGVEQAGGERRLGVDRRCFSYTAYLPERRSGHERRSTDKI